MDKLCFILGSLLALPFCVGLFEDLPRIHTDDGNLFIVSGKDRNITLISNGGGAIYANGINLLRPQSALGIFNSSLRNIRLNRMVTSIRRDIDGPRTGIKARLRALENRTRNDNGPPNRRFRQLSNRITTIATQVDSLLRKLEENNCRSYPCQNGGVCLDLFDGFLCQCPNNWEGPTCAADVNECARFAGTDLGCQNGASCQNTPGGYNCICADGYQGIHCTRKNLDCATGGAELCGRGTCIQKGTSFTCICDQGWTTNGVSPQCTTDVNECLSEVPHCSKDPVVNCVNTPGSFRCGACPPGFTGNGFYCTDINECDHNNGGCSMAPLVQCFNTPGSHHCGFCPLGYTGDGRSCQGESGFLGLCSRGVCHPLANCMEIGGTINCRCPPTHTGNGMGANGCVRDTSPRCPLAPCKNGGTCNTATLTCSCPNGFEPPYCDAPTSCASNPCLNGGTCRENPVARSFTRSFICTCPRNFVGVYCERQQSGCNAVLRGPSGSLDFPVGNASEYSHNSRCVWLIRTDENKVLNVTFSKFALESTTMCNADFLQIHDGRTSADQLLGRFCGSELPLGGKIMSSREYLYLYFRSDASHAGDGFSLSWISSDPICGGNITATTYGVISSPGSPGNYPPDRDCWWRLSANPGKRIQLHFMVMKIESHPSCSFDYLAIHDGLGDEAALLEKYCNTSHPEPFISPANELSLHFHSDSDSTDTGFQIHYTVVEGVPGCGGTFTSLNGEISSPTKDGKYQDNLECEYLIKLSPGSRILIEFNELEIESHNECSFDYLELYEGGTDRDPLVARYCGSNKIDSYTSQGNKLLFKFRSDFSNSGKGFRITYSIVCGGTYDSETGIISSPMYPETYHKEKECLYEIIAPIGKAIVLDWMDFDLEGNSIPDCHYDYVVVYDGLPDDDSKIGRYCGDGIPPQATSRMNLMTLKFATDGSIEGRGWRANYTFVDTGCGGVIKTLNQTISPPQREAVPLPSMRGFEELPAHIRERMEQRWGSAGRTEHNQDCTWIIVAPPKNSVTLNWNSFDIEDSENCDFDSVNITEGTESRKYCGTNIPSVMTTVGNVVKIRFVSDSSFSSVGFQLTYSFNPPGSKCGGTFFAAGGFLQSPNFPNSYSKFSDCAWTITAPPGHQILLKPKTFVLEHSDNCGFDYLEVRNGATANATLLGKYCGLFFPDNLRSHSNSLYLRFVTDFSQNEQGFDIEWESTATGCGGLLTTHEGSISSPNYPQSYHTRALCNYQIKTSHGSALEITFDEIDFEGRNYCFDSVNVLDGRTQRSLTNGSVCVQPTPPFNLTTTGHTALVTFKSDASDSGRGFSLKYRTICNRKLSGFGGVIESPNFPNNYPHHADCAWSIDVPPGNKIGIEFSHFKMEIPLFTDKCDFDYMEIVELDVDGREIGRARHCRETPKPVESSARTVQIVLHSDVSQSDSGFRLEWRIIGCGGLLDRPTGRIQESNFNRSVPTECKWKIVSSIGRHVELNIAEFHYEGGGADCGGLTIASNEDFTHPTLTQCSLLTPGTIVRSSGHEMFIKYQMLRSSPTSFIATYKEGITNCGGQLTNKGTVSTTNYPNNYDVNQDCEWLLEVPADHTMTITLTDIDLFESVNCSHTELKIFDGDKEIEEKSLLTWCNSSMPAQTKLVTLSNKALVKFHSGEDNPSKGFLLSFEKNCGATISTTSSGRFEIQDSDVSCTWIITSPNPLDRIRFQVHHLSGNVTGFQDVMTFDPAMPLMNTHIFYTPGNQLAVTLKVAGPVVLQASYSVYENFCGGVFTSLEGTITSPNYPASYPLNLECIYVIGASPGNGISINVNFNLEESENCADDYVEVREGGSHGQFLHVHCGTGQKSAVIADAAWIKFRSDNDTVGTGFTLDYSYAEQVEITKSSGELTSPLYPNRLLTSKSFSWRIAVPSGQVMTVSFDDFILQTLESGLCATTFTIYDGYNEEAPVLIENVCGYTAPPAKMTVSNYIYVKATFNAQMGSKFKLKWQAVPPKTVEETTLDICNSSTITLGNRSALIKSPGYPMGYDANLNCSWILKTDDPSAHVAFILTTVDLEEVENCLADYVSIYTSTDLVTWEKNSTVCNDNNRRFFHGTPYLMVQFRSDVYINKTGFAGSAYRMCGGTLTGSSGEIRMSDLESRMMSSQCDWKVRVRNGRTIQFTFTEFDFPNADGSCSSSISIKNGPDEFSPALGNGTYCGPGIPKNITETFSNRAFVRFNMRMMMNVKFVLTYQEVSQECGDEITLTSTQNSTIIHTPNYPNVPEAHSECTWNIWSKSGESLKIEFIDRFDITYSPNCAQEYVELRSGMTKYSNGVGKYCGKKPDMTHSPTNMIQIKYFSDIPYPKTGFKARISLSGCDRIFQGQGGLIQTPLEMHVPANTVCEYTILGSPGYKMALNFTNTCLGDDYDECAGGENLFEVLTVYPAGRVLNDTRISNGNYSHENFPSSIFVESNKAVIRFNASIVSLHRFQLRLTFKAQFNNCGGTLTGESGEITSPGYPTSRYRQKFCNWLVTVPKGRRIKVEILDIDLGNRTFPVMQRLNFYNDARPSLRIATVTGSETPEIMYSTDNVMKITYFVINGQEIRGFKLKYSSEEASLCEGTLDGQSGVIETPANLTSLYCNYERTDKPFFADTSRGTISFRIQEARMTAMYSNMMRCSPYQSRIRFTKNNAENPTEMARFCGNITETSISSPFTMTNFEISLHNGNDRVKVYYEIEKCGEIFTSPFQISSADLPDKNGALNCAWFYKTDESADLSIEYNGTMSACAEEYLTIYNGPGIDSPQLAKICGESPVTKIHSRTSNLFIQYHSNISNNRTKFSVKVDSLLNSCGGTVHKSIPRIQNPGNGSYADNMDCTWELIADVGYKVNMSFVERFYLEDSVNCTKDSVEIFDYVNEEWKSLGKFCGRQQPGRLASSESKLKVRFISDARVNGDGFTIQWEQQCGGVYHVSEKTRTLVSPGYPTRYLPNLYCNYTLIAPKGKTLQVKFLEFKLEMRRNCEFDNVTIYSNPEYIISDDLMKQESFCSFNMDIPPIQRAKDRMWIIFQSDKFIQKKGFEFTYKLDTCGGVITESTSISSNPETATYATQKTCVWNITAPTDKEIVIRFNYFELGHTQGCYMDYVDIYSGAGANAARLIHLCGNHTTMAPIKLQHSDGSIKFSSGYEEFRGFSAEVIFVKRCDRRINLSTTAPNYELSETGTSYVRDMDCHYVILAPEGFSLKMEVTNFHMQECKFNETAIDPCSCDFLEVRDGRGPFSELVGKYCGHNIPPSFSSSRDGMFVRLVTDSGDVSTGFTARFSIVPNSCGEMNYEIRDSEFVKLTYPKSSGDYESNINCMWTFTVPGSEYLTMQLHFDRMDIENGTDGNCDTDYLEIYDYLHQDVIYEGLGSDVVYSGSEQSHVQVSFYDSRNVRTKHVYCGNRIPPVFLSKTNKVFVRFKSNSQKAGKGFSIIASKSSGCRPVYQELQGRIVFSATIPCNINILVPVNHTIALFFTSFYIACEQEQELTVFDGDMATATSQKLCGYQVPEPYFSTGNRVTLKVPQQIAGSFDVTYLATDKGRGCGGTLFNYHGAFSSQMFPTPDRNPSDCRWDILVPTNLKVALRFSVFDLGSKQYCPSDYVTVYELSNGEEKELSRFCGGDTPAQIVSKTSAIAVRFVKTLNFNGSGFKAEFMGVFQNANVTNF